MKKIIAIALALIVALSLTVSLSATALSSKGFVPFKLAGGSGSDNGNGGGSGENSGEPESTTAAPTEPTTKAPCSCGKEDCKCNDNEHCTCNETTTKEATTAESTTKNEDEQKKQSILDKVKALLNGAKLPDGLDADKIMDALKKLDLSALIAGLGSGDFSLDTVINFVKGLIGGGSNSGSDTEKTTAAPGTTAPTQPTPTTSPYVPNVNTGDAA